ncbi:hypothetical protein EJB05_26804, partial [Eragrostis curvula]
MCRGAAALWVTQVCGWVAATRSLRVLAALLSPFPTSVVAPLPRTTTSQPSPSFLSSFREPPSPRHSRQPPPGAAGSRVRPAGREEERTKIRRKPRTRIIWAWWLTQRALIHCLAVQMLPLTSPLMGKSLIIWYPLVSSCFTAVSFVFFFWLSDL